LLTPDEELVEDATERMGTDIALLSRRLIETIDWAAEQPSLTRLPIGLFVTGRGAAAALVASVVEHGRVAAIVSTGGWLEQAGPVLRRVTTPTLLIVAGDDPADARECEAAFRRMPSSCEMVLVKGTTSRRDLAVAAEEIGRHALSWFERHLAEAPFSAGATDDAW
jgi:dienelactone hydrolase